MATAEISESVKIISSYIAVKTNFDRSVEIKRLFFKIF